MMANRHKRGGGVAPKHDADKEEYNAKGSKVMKEAKEKKSGGAIKKATGGKIETKAAGGAAKPRLDKRARGGGVHASGKDETASPFSAAHDKPSEPGGNPHPHRGK